METVECRTHLIGGSVCKCAEAGKRLCYMNVASDEVIRSLFFNKHNQNLITVSVYSGDNYTSLRCRTTPLECGKP